MATTPSPEDQKALYAETDARFWAQTGYRPGQKLDPKNPLDARMIPTYANIYNKVLAQWRAGTITWTYGTQIVATLIDAARDASADAAAHMDAVASAIAGKTPEKAQQHLAAAQEAHQVAQTRTAEAAQLQPPTVSHPHVAQATHQIQQFVMNGAGQGVPVTSGADAVAAMQATAAPARAAMIDSASEDRTIAEARQLARERDEDHAAHASPKGVGSIIAIAAAAVAAVGLVVIGARGPTVIAGRPRARPMRSVYVPRLSRSGRFA